MVVEQGVSQHALGFSKGVFPQPEPQARGSNFRVMLQMLRYSGLFVN